MISLPPDARVRRTYSYALLTVKPIRILEYDLKRVWAHIVGDDLLSSFLVLASTPGQIVHSAGNEAVYTSGEYFYGPEELWAAVGSGGADNTAALWLHQLFLV